MSRSGSLNAARPTGLADLVRLWAQALQADPACDRPQDEWCRLLDLPGFIGGQSESIQLPSELDLPEPEPAMDPLDLQPLPMPDFPSAQRPRLQAPVLAVVSADFKPEPEGEAEAQTSHALPDLQDADYAPLEPAASAPWLPLAPITRLWPALRRFAPFREAGPDLPRLVGEFALCRPARRLPMLRRRGRYRRLLVIRDWRKCMIPFERDFEQLIGRLRRQQQAESLVESACHGFPPAIPSNVDAVLVLGDLGLCASSETAASTELWAAWARVLRVRGVAVEAWVPVSAQRIPANLARVMPCIPWHERSRFRPTRGQHGVLQPCSEQRDTWMGRLFPLLAIAQRIEPALLRRARLLSGGEGYPEWEAVLWDSSEQHAAGEGFLQLRSSRVPVWRELFARLFPTMQHKVWQMFCEQHAHLPRSTLMVERLIWATYVDHDTEVSSVGKALDEAREWLARMSAQEVRHAAFQIDPLGQACALHSGFLHGLVQRNAGDVRFTARYAATYAPLALSVGRPEGKGVPATEWLDAIRRFRSSPDLLDFSVCLHHRSHGAYIERWREEVNPHKMPPVQQRRPLLPQARRHSELWQPDGQTPHLFSAKQAAEPGVMRFFDAYGRHEIRFDYLYREAWQHALGQDSYGVFCEMLIKSMCLRFRYIPPGTFFQGSPQGCGNDVEKPRHAVTLTQGFWLAEIPCTQALWHAVMANNPSYFKRGGDAARRPVEGVSWDDVMVFLEKMQLMLPSGCDAALPTESQWEYACRAGTHTEYWWGDSPEDCRANWNHKHLHTTPVDYYPPNPWGLYDMHGNVYEWCADRLRNYTDQSVSDPLGPGDGDGRVVKGGSWSVEPSSARAASRAAGRRWSVFNSRGFRIALYSSVFHFSKKYE